MICGDASPHLVAHLVRVALIDGLGREEEGVISLGHLRHNAPHSLAFEGRSTAAGGGGQPSRTGHIDDETYLVKCSAGFLKS